MNDHFSDGRAVAVTINKNPGDFWQVLFNTAQKFIPLLTLFNFFNEDIKQVIRKTSHLFLLIKREQGR